MDIKIVKSKKCLCTCCMEEHEVKTVLVLEQATFKNVKVDYNASYLYCDVAEEMYMDEKQMQENDIRLKDAYRKKAGLLTSTDIYEIRTKYGISQGDFCLLLGWGGKTVTRYEGHQVQDRAHDAILKKIDEDSKWYLSLLVESKNNLAEENYKRYLKIATELCEKNQDNYLRKTIETKYARYYDDLLLHGNTELSLDKTVDVIRYYAASKNITSLYKVKLMKMMWYADALSYKRRGHAITGLIYQAMPMGALPIGHNLIIDLKGVPCEEVDMGENTAYHFCLDKKSIFSSLSEDDKQILDIVIGKLGKMSRSEIVSFMHNEQAYVNTAAESEISFEYAKFLQI